MKPKPYAYAYEWASWISTEGPRDFHACIEREAPPQWAIDEGQARNVVPLYDRLPIQGEPVAIVVSSSWDSDRGSTCSIQAIMPTSLKCGDKLYAEEHRSPTCHWACTGCNICGNAGHGDSWF